MVAPGHHLEALIGPIVKHQRAGTDFLSTGHRSRLTWRHKKADSLFLLLVGYKGCRAPPVAY